MRTCTAPASQSRRAISRMRLDARFAVATLGMLVLILPTALRSQALAHGAAAPPRGPFEMVRRAGVGAMTLSPSAFVPSMVGDEKRASVMQRDTSGHHGSRAHHAAVGALIGGTTGLALGLVLDRMWFGSSDGRGHFQHLWHVTAPFGALVGALAGTLRQAD